MTVAKVYKPLSEPNVSEGDTAVFLGGSIEMGAAIDWQTKLTFDLRNYEIKIINPRRDDWDSTWSQDPTEGTQFFSQVQWEMEGQEAATHKVYYFDPKTKSPITLMELGLYGDVSSTIVCCPKDFWRYGNVKMVCDRYMITCVETYDEMLGWLKDEFKDLLTH